MQPAESDYSHRFHIGNHADVFKHAGLLTALAHLPRPLTVVETHAGEGRYRLGATGEWTAGVGRVWAAQAELPALPALQRYLDALRQLDARPWAKGAQGGVEGAYPGSPVLAATALGGAGRVRAHELAPDAAQALRGAVAGLPVEVVEGDGYAAAPQPDALWFVDPPYVTREDWTQAPDAVARARQGATGTFAAVIWYPIKSWSRPNGLLARLKERGVPFVSVDLVVTPLELKRPSLAGSGLALVGVPEAAALEIGALAAALGPRLATHGGRWSVRVQGEPG
jgi:23S rRNA (adenine2030-N6)-methyltransferase